MPPFFNPLAGRVALPPLSAVLCAQTHGTPPSLAGRLHGAGIFLGMRMSEELKDFRAKITATIDCALEAESRATGRDRQEIFREVMGAWADQRIHVATVLDRLLKSEGLAGVSEGTQVKPRGNRGE